MPGLLEYYPHSPLHTEYLNAARQSDKPIAPKEKTTLIKKAQDAFISAVKDLVKSAPSMNFMVGLSDCDILSTFDSEKFLEALKNGSDYIQGDPNNISPETSFRAFEPEEKALSDYVLSLDFTFDRPTDLISRLTSTHSDLENPDLPIHTHASLSSCEFCQFSNEDLNGKFIDTPKAFSLSDLLTLFEFVKQ